MALFKTVQTWIDTGVTTSGVATFHPTDDGTANGAAIFSSISAVQFTAEVNTGIVTSVAMCGLKSISGDLKTILVNVVTGTILGVLGGTIIGCPDGTKVHALVMGQ